jgi:hypothetical protein
MLAWDDSDCTKVINILFNWMKCEFGIIDALSLPNNCIYDLCDCQVVFHVVTTDF